MGQRIWRYRYADLRVEGRAEGSRDVGEKGQETGRRGRVGSHWKKGSMGWG